MELDIRKLTYHIARARVLLTEKRIAEAMAHLDNAVYCLPDKYWPLDRDLLPEEAVKK
jgi:hypothetical protein